MFNTSERAGFEGVRRVFCEALGTGFSLPDVPERIVSFSPAVTETLFLLGAGDSIAGVSAFCARPEEARKKRVLGSYNTVDRKILAELNPDVIFTVTGYQRDFALKLSKEMPVYAIELPVSLAGIIDMVVKVGLVTNRIHEAHNVSCVLYTALAQLKPLNQRPKVYVEIDFNGPVSFGAFSYITDAVRFLGGESVFGNEACEWLTPNLADVVQMDPDLIVYEPKMYSRFALSDLRNMLEERNWTGLRAVRNNNVYMTPGPLDFLAHHGPSFISAAVPWLRAQFESASSSLC